MPQDKTDPHSAPSNWWFIDAQGRKIGWLWPEDMLSMIEAIWGYRQGIGGFARYAGLHRVTVEQYCNGKRAIPKHIALLVMSLSENMLDKGGHMKAHPWRVLPQIEAEWLPSERYEPAFDIEKLPHG